MFDRLADDLEDDQYSEVPSYMICPITQGIMQDPVRILESTNKKQCYERRAIKDYFATQQRLNLPKKDLITGRVLKTISLISESHLKIEIEKWKDSHSVDPTLDTAYSPDSDGYIDERNDREEEMRLALEERRVAEARRQLEEKRRIRCLVVVGFSAYLITSIAMGYYLFHLIENSVASEEQNWIKDFMDKSAHIFEGITGIKPKHPGLRLKGSFKIGDGDGRRNFPFAADNSVEAANEKVSNLNNQEIKFQVLSAPIFSAQPRVPKSVAEDIRKQGQSQFKGTLLYQNQMINDDSFTNLPADEEKKTKYKK